MATGSRILIVTDARPGTSLGNRVTAQRWQAILRELGHRVRIAPRFEGQDCDVLVALHARKSAGSVESFSRHSPRGRIVVAMTGTDLYAAGGIEARSRGSLARADRIVVLQREGLLRLDPRERAKASVILQSARRAPSAIRRRRGGFLVVALGHLRAVKDPVLAAHAARLLPRDSPVRIEHYGSARDPAVARRASAETRRNPRWSWRGERTHARTLEILRGADAFVQTSRAEGGSSAMAEAIVCGLPVLSTRIPGAIGMLGRRHGGYFEPGDARGLAELLVRLERDARFRTSLRAASLRLAPRFSPREELRAWSALLRGLGIDSRGQDPLRFAIRR
jgi:putative glycosyltransferase (TIGR04348 family)